MHSLIVAWASWLVALLLPAHHTEVDYYGEAFELEYHADVFRNGPLVVDQAGIRDFYANVAKQDWTPLFEQLEERREDYELNDWLYYRLINTTVATVADFASQNERRMLEMHLLTMAGFDTRICYAADDIFLYVRTEESLYEVPIVRDGDKRYINITSALNPRRNLTRTLQMHPMRILPEGIPFGFALEYMPRLTPRLVERPYRFEHRDSMITLRGLSDRTIADWMGEYPFFAEGLYLETPLSAPTRERMLEEFRPLIAGKSEKEILELLVSFTRSAFVYKEDKKSFGFSKPMIPDEVLYYPVSDCEDRSALFYTLVKDLLDIPVIAIAYDDHLSVAVASDELEGLEILHNGREYFVCDPTGPSGSSAIGNPPYGYANRPFDIVADYVPATRGAVAMR